MARNPESSKPTAKMIRLYHVLVSGLGEPEDLWVFDPAELPQPNNLRLIHVSTSQAGLPTRIAP